MIVWYLAWSMIIGIFIGWILRSVVFAVEKDCANPRHRRRVR